jgi:hypothetical protein
MYNKLRLRALRCTESERAPWFVVPFSTFLAVMVVSSEGLHGLSQKYHFFLLILVVSNSD